MRNLTNGLERIEIEARNVGQLVEGLESRFPGFRNRLCDEHTEKIRPSIAVMVDGRSASKGFLEPISDDSEIHLLPAFGGG